MKLLAIVLFAATAAAAQQPSRDAIGSVVIQRGSGPAPFILIAVDAFDEGARSDGAIDFVYKFYTDGEAPEVHYAFPLAYIEELDGQVVISAPAENVRLTFANRDRPVAQVPNNGGTELVFTNGAGIARYWGEKVNRGRMCRDGGELRLVCEGACYGD